MWTRFVILFVLILNANIFFFKLKIRSRLSSYSVDPFDLSIVSQTECPKEKEDGVNIHIDPNTFSTSNIANVFRKAGEKLGDGFEYVVGAGKKVGGVAKTILF